MKIMVIFVSLAVIEILIVIIIQQCEKILGENFRQLHQEQ